MKNDKVIVIDIGAKQGEPIELKRHTGMIVNGREFFETIGVLYCDLELAEELIYAYNNQYV